jgi:hypothetical protein
MQPEARQQMMEALSAAERQRAQVLLGTRPAGGEREVQMLTRTVKKTRKETQMKLNKTMAVST